MEYSKEDKAFGPAGWISKPTGNYYDPTQHLYPLPQKFILMKNLTLTNWSILNMI